MRAAWRERYGGPEVVDVLDLPDPVPGPGEVLVRMRAASVNRADLDGLYPRWRPLRLILGVRRPRVRWLGSDVAGVVEAIGDEVTRFAPGDAVVGDLYGLDRGAFAELVAAPERRWTHLPAGVSFEAGASLPHSAILALQGLRRGRRTVAAGERVLVVGASGSVGPFAVQLAKARGAEVTGVASGAKLDLVLASGADRALDYRTTDATRTGDRYDWILDVDGHLSLRDARRALVPGGIYQTLGGSGSRIIAALVLGPVLSLVGGRTVGLMLGWKPWDPDDVATILGLVADGTLRPVIERTYPLDAVAEALRHVDEGRARGKVVVTVAPPT